MEETLSLFIIFGMPLLFAAFFIASLIGYLITPKENVKKKRVWKVLLIVSAIIAALLGIVIIALIVLMMSAMMYM